MRTQARSLGLKQRGQALIESLLVLPLLLLLAGATAQFTLLFLFQVRFEQACHQAARRYAAGLTEAPGFARMILERMGSYRRFLKDGSIQVRPGGLTQPRAAGQGLGALGSTAGFLKLPAGVLLDHGGGLWTASAIAKPPLLFRSLFPEGIPFRAQFHILRHPRRGSHGS